MLDRDAGHVAPDLADEFGNRPCRPVRQVEGLVAAGRLTRFERDNAGRWFLHSGQHSHAGSANAHVAEMIGARHDQEGDVPVRLEPE